MAARSGAGALLEHDAVAATIGVWAVIGGGFVGGLVAVWLVG